MLLQFRLLEVLSYWWPGLFEEVLGHRFTCLWGVQVLVPVLLAAQLPSTRTEALQTRRRILNPASPAWRLMGLSQPVLVSYIWAYNPSYGLLNRLYIGYPDRK